MLNRLTILILFAIFTGTNQSVSFGQGLENSKCLISLKQGHLFVKTDNQIKIVAQQNDSVSIHQVKAVLKYNSISTPLELVSKNGYFIINPDTMGIVEITINLKDTIETKKLIVKPIEVFGNIGGFGANYAEKIDASQFKVQQGLSAQVMCCGFDAKCTDVEFEMIRISKKNEVERSYNNGSYFEQNTKNIIMNAISGDTFIFKKIWCTCFFSQRLNDMIFEIK